MIIQYRNVAEYHSVVFRGPGRLEILQSETPSLCIEASGPHLDKIETRVEEGTLYLGIKVSDVIDLSTFRSDITYKISLRELKCLRVSGRTQVKFPDMDRDELNIHAAGHAEVELPKLTADQINLKLSGQATVKVSGDVERQIAQISDQASLTSDELVCDHADIRLVGASSAVIRVNDELNAYIAESAKLTYVGYPDVEKYGAGTLVRRRRQTPTTRGTEHG